ncbi:MAG: type II toxin-antitoxin system VapC family toxin [Chloroflexota bacterium]
MDTNILVYATVPEAPRHQEAAEAIERLDAAGLELWISRQVLREFLATLTRPQTFGEPPPLAHVIAAVQSFESQFHVADEDASVTQQLTALIQQVTVGGKQIHDANIVATMQVHGVTHLLTANPTDFRRFAHLITVVPLEAAATLLGGSEKP